ncbi:redoxin domain-containing protein [Mucilaginibacter mali]|uniref:Redoxin domain-containing protein n=1 Tax=Mucilaginibacter mali TaxID=2740462 RepID=A0A7D4UDY4_9SPHI|nr:TlpA family protein disulfide reductase [Mucilaginibacter mali]QKJ28296.1 redoxin domain-containing protein [Mucilaginibacter mali]
MIKKALVTVFCLLPSIIFAQTAKRPALADTSDMASYNVYIKPIKDKIAKLTAAFMKAPTATRVSKKYQDIYQPKFDSLYKESDRLNREWVMRHPNSPSSLTALTASYMAYHDYEHTSAAFNSLSDQLKNTDKGKLIAKNIEKFNTVALGADAPEFSQAAPDGKMISLSSFKGKYLLIEFWASWCVPCRAKNPDLIKTYQKFREKNFAILGVSSDKDKQAWVAAIKKDGLTWPQVSDLQYRNNAVALLYRVHAIPQNFLINPDGKVVAKNLFGKDLDKKLGEILGVM